MEEYEIAILKVEKYNREREEQKPWESNQRKIKKYYVCTCHMDICDFYDKNDETVKSGL